jgi:hypothetical protein
MYSSSVIDSISASFPRTCSSSKFLPPIVNCKVSWSPPLSLRSDTSSQATHLRLRQFIGQDLAALEFCFDNQRDFNDYTTKHFSWKYAMCHLSIYE